MSLFGGKMSDAPGLGVSAVPTSRITGSSAKPAPGWEGTDFIVKIEGRRTTVCLLYGETGLGKTTFLTRYCPAPVALINFDGRARTALEEAERLGRRVIPAYVPMPRGIRRMGTDQAKKAAQAWIDRVLTNYDRALDKASSGEVRTIGIDTGTEFDSMLQVSHRGNATGAFKDHGMMKSLIQRQWGSMVADARAAGVHLVVLSRSQPIWIDNESTGDFKPRIEDTVREAVDWAGHIRLRRSRPVVGVPVAGEGGSLGLGLAAAVQKVGRIGEIRELEIQVTKAGNNLALLGEVYTGDEWADDGPFVHLCAQLTPGSVPDDWR